MFIELTSFHSFVLPTLFLYYLVIVSANSYHIATYHTEPKQTTPENNGSANGTVGSTSPSDFFFKCSSMASSYILVRLEQFEEHFYVFERSVKGNIDIWRCKAEFDISSSKMFFFKRMRLNHPFELN